MEDKAFVTRPTQDAQDMPSTATFRRRRGWDIGSLPFVGFALQIRLPVTGISRGVSRYSRLGQIHRAILPVVVQTVEFPRASSKRDVAGLDISPNEVPVPRAAGPAKPSPAGRHSRAFRPSPPAGAPSRGNRVHLRVLPGPPRGYPAVRAACGVVDRSNMALNQIS